MAKILLTGGTGLVGTQIGIALTRAGHKITALTRQGNAAQLAFPARCIAWDHKSNLASETLSPDHEPFDAVIHLAGEPVAQRWTAAAKNRIYESRVSSTKALVRSVMSLSAQPEVWINASAVGFYGADVTTTCDESTPAGNDYLSSVCSDWENAMGALSADTRKIAMRLGVVLSLEGGALPKMLTPFRYGAGGQLGDGSQVVPWVHIDDVVSSIIFVLNNKKCGGPFNVVAPQRTTNKDLTAAIASSMRLPAFLSVPRVFLRAVLGEMSVIILNGAEVRPTSLVRAGFKFKFESISEAIAGILSPLREYGTRLLVARQWLEGSPESLFPFFSAAENLERITPPWLHFRVTKKSSDEMKSGLLIDYKLKIKGVPVSWRTRIENWDPPRQFTDTQLNGPYKIWHHTHKFEALGSGTLMTDEVIYKIRFWPFGDVAMPMVQNDVNTIFNYRKSVIGGLLARR